MRGRNRTWRRQARRPGARHAEKRAGTQMVHCAMHRAPKWLALRDPAGLPPGRHRWHGLCLSLCMAANGGRLADGVGAQSWTTALCRSDGGTPAARNVFYFEEAFMRNKPGKTDITNTGRRDWLGSAAKAVAGAGLLGLVDPLVRAGAWAAGSDAPEKAEVRIGFIPLTDCASVVMASVLGLDKKHGVKIVPSKEASWAGVRDKLINGELDFAHVLYGLVYGVHLGIGGPRK